MWRGDLDENGTFIEAMHWSKCRHFNCFLYAYFYKVFSTLEACKWLQSKLRTPRYRSAKIVSLGGKTGTDITDRDVQADIQRMLRDIIITHVPMEKMNFQDRVLFLGQMIRYLVLLADGQIPVSTHFNCRCKISLRWNFLFARLNTFISFSTVAWWSRLLWQQADRSCGVLNCSSLWRRL